MELNRANARLASKAEQAVNLESLLEQQKLKYARLDDEFNLLQQSKAADQSFSSSDSNTNSQLQAYQLEIENLKQIVLSLELSNQELSTMVDEKNTELEGEKDINVWLRELMAKVGERDESNTLLLEEVKGDKEQLLARLNEAIHERDIKSDEVTALQRENEILRKAVYADGDGDGGIPIKTENHSNSINRLSARIEPGDGYHEKRPDLDSANPHPDASQLLFEELGSSFQGIFNASNDDLSISRLADRLEHAEKRYLFI
jgi:chromosome segregation ATPase